MKTFTQITAFALATIGLAACAGSASSSMNTGERISARGDNIAQYGNDWSAGNKALRDGEKLATKSAERIDKARKQLAEAEADQVKARGMISDGTSMMQRSEADYAATRAGPSANPVPQP